MATPRLSLVVIIHRMARQAENTLYSLSARFQRNVREEDYEIIAVENDSDDLLGEERARAQAGNLRYFQRQETGVTPVPALNFGFEQSRGPIVGFIIDGARMASPRCVELALLAARLYQHPLVIVPGYHLGEQQHHLNRGSGHDEATERALLEGVDWKNDGYALFKIACFSGANPRGFFTQFLESNCFFCRRDSFEKIGRADPRFTLPGGGSVNIFLYHALARLPESRLCVLAGEGSFHQFHGGVTTVEVEDREERLETHRANLAEIFGGPFKGMHREPTLLGALPPSLLPFLRVSSQHAAEQYQLCRAKNQPQWQTPDPAAAERVSVAAPSGSASMSAPDPTRAELVKRALQRRALAEAALPAERSTLVDFHRLFRISRERAKDYRLAQPFPHIVIDDFLPEDSLRAVLEGMPSRDDPNVVWGNLNASLADGRPAQARKYHLQNVLHMRPVLRQLIAEMNSGTFALTLSQLTGIDDLIVDAQMLGGGVHLVERGGLLRVHADFRRHLAYNLERRLNLLLYMNPDWPEAWGGHLELWDAEMKHCVERVAPIANRCVIFNTTKDSFHGHPRPLECPDGVLRQSIALYYYTAEPSAQVDDSHHSTAWQELPEEKDGAQA